MKIILSLIFLYMLFSCSKKNDSVSISCSNPSNVSFPFDYVEENSSLWIKSGEIEDQKIFLSLGPFGGHTHGMTGHFVGDAKQNINGFFVKSKADLELLVDNDANGVCDVDEGDVCGMAENDIIIRRPLFKVPEGINSGLVTSVKLETIYTNNTFYYGGSTIKHWSIDIQVCDYNFHYGHIDNLNEEFRQKLIAAGVTDPNTVTASDVGVNLVEGKEVYVSSGDKLAYPQVVAYEIPGHDGYFNGASSGKPPWAQMEFNHRDGSYTESYYLLLPESERNILKGHIESEMTDANSPRYGGYFSSLFYRWLLLAEATLETSPRTYREDYSNLSSNLGGWVEDPSTTSNSQSCTGNTAFCDEVISIFPVAKTSGVYDSSLYHSTNVSHLIFYRKRNPEADRWGEILETLDVFDKQGTLTIGWHGEAGGVPDQSITHYQKIKYVLNSTEKQLKIRWGNVASDLNSASVPADIGSASCNGTTLTCHNHSYHGD